MSIIPSITFFPVYCVVSPKTCAAAELQIASPAWVVSRCLSLATFKTSATSIFTTFSRAAISSILSTGNKAATMLLNLLCTTAPKDSMAEKLLSFTTTNAEIMLLPSTCSTSAIGRLLYIFIFATSSAPTGKADTKVSLTLDFELDLGNCISPRCSLRNIRVLCENLCSFCAHPTSMEPMAMTTNKKRFPIFLFSDIVFIVQNILQIIVH